MALSTARRSSAPWQPGAPAIGLTWLPAFTRDLAVVLAVVALYFLVRGAAPNPLDRSLAVTNWIIACEQTLHIYWEPTVQDWSIRSGALKEFANAVYAYAHFPVLGLVAIWLWGRDRERFRFVRNVMFVSMLFGIVCYYLFPAVPPRLMATHGYDLGFTDTVFGGDTAVSYAQPSFILNEYAAIPSFHFGWIALASAAIWVNSTHPGARVLAVALTAIMSWAIVATGNHFFFDMALGGLVVAVSWWLVSRPSLAARPVRAPASNA
ncbi:MAG: phosphatase PAP2 family protein [Dehalococcoidia bacterium]